MKSSKKITSHSLSARKKIVRGGFYPFLTIFKHTDDADLADFYRWFQNISANSCNSRQRNLKSKIVNKKNVIFAKNCNHTLKK